MGQTMLILLVFVLEKSLDFVSIKLYEPCDCIDGILENPL